MPRRYRRILYSALLMALASAVTAWFIWEGDDTRRRYIPGEEVEGLTTRLERGVPEDYTPVTFTDATKEAGIRFQHFGFDRTSQLPEDMGSGAAWLDYDNDGWDDLFVVNYSAPLDTEVDRPSRCALYRNNGDGTFQDVSQPSGLDLAIRGMGFAAGDYNNDGWTDLAVTAYGRSVLMKNNGDGTFTNVTARAGLDGREGYWAGASWADYDRDGDLDLYITGYVKYVDFGLPGSDLAAEEPASINPSSFRPERNLFYRNNGDGTFTEIARQSGVENPSGRSLSATWADFNNDLWPDLYVANDVSDNVLYLNRQNGTFEDISHSAHVADYRGAMGIAAGDWDNDLDMDLFITHWIAQENALFTNRWNDTLRSRTGQSLQFKDDSAIHGLGQSSLDYIAWATSFKDLDLDGKLDLFIANGSTFQMPDEPTRLRPMPDQVYWNGGKRRGFFDVSSVSGPYFEDSYVGRGAAFSDYDRDGDPDLFLVNHNGPGILLRNDSDLGRNWLAVRLEGKKSGHSAVGARLRLVAGDLEQIRQVGSQSSYLSQDSHVQLFGLGERPGVDTLEVTWPTGKRELHLNLKPNRLLKIVEGQRRASPL
ncbi:MAG: CRTAC1 family protein [Balneolaceae bacterium]|nr:CRTAC1 family protein [Balneolaceae bacterium]